MNKRTKYLFIRARTGFKSWQIDDCISKERGMKLYHRDDGPAVTNLIKGAYYTAYWYYGTMHHKADHEMLMEIQYPLDKKAALL